MTTPLASRDALGAWLMQRMDSKAWADASDWARDFWRREADALLASGVVRDSATLADDDRLVERMRDEFPDAASRGNLRIILRALAAALSEER